MRLAAFVALACLAACREEPTFEERYEAAGKRINTKAAEMDRELADRPNGPIEETAPEEP